MGIGHIRGVGPVGPAAGGRATQPRAVGALYEGEVGTATCLITRSLLTDEDLWAAGGGQQLAINLSDEPEGGSQRSAVFTRDGEAPYLTIEPVTYEAPRPGRRRGIGRAGAVHAHHRRHRSGFARARHQDNAAGGSIG